MTRSLANGDYRLLAAVESASRQDRWYRVCADREQPGRLSCDCPPWTFARETDAAGERTCKHTRDVARWREREIVPAGRRVYSAQASAEALDVARADERAAEATQVAVDPLLARLPERWPGLIGHWQAEVGTAQLAGANATLVNLQFIRRDGMSFTGRVAFAARYARTPAQMAADTAGWAGWAVAQQLVERVGGFRLGAPPAHHYRHTRTPARPLGVPAPAPTPPQRGGRYAPTQPQQGRLAGTDGAQVIGGGVVIPSELDPLAAGNLTDLRDGLTPAARAEATLQLFLGDALYGQLERDGFLDVPSALYAGEQRVYRLRRDPRHRGVRRVRVFKRGAYVQDLCLVPGGYEWGARSQAPEADHFLSLFLGFLSDERSTLDILTRNNLFEPYSDESYGYGHTPEVIPAIWRPRGDLN